MLPWPTAPVSALLALGLACPVFAATLAGQSQSPIDIETRKAVFTQLDPLVFDYDTSVTLTLVDTGSPSFESAVRADVPPPCPVCGGIHAGGDTPGSTLTIGGTVYDLVQFHLHAGAEHLIDGVRGAMELHLVHRALDGSLAVVGQILRLGAENEALAPYFDALEHLAGDPVLVPDFNLAALLPDDLRSFRYTGSLTAPNSTNPEEPFLEPVAWNVLYAQGEISQRQLNQFLSLFPQGNSREEQPLNDRIVLTDVPVSPIPLPAGGLLLLSSGAALALLRRRAA